MRIAFKVETAFPDQGTIYNWFVPPKAGQSIHVYALWISNTLAVAVGGAPPQVELTPIRNDDGSTATVYISQTSADTTGINMPSAIRFWPIEPDGDPHPLVVPQGTTLTINAVFGGQGHGEGTPNAALWYDYI